MGLGFLKRRKLTNEVSALFARNAAHFGGLYNALARIATKKNKGKYKALDEFYQRLGYTEGGEALQARLQAYFPVSETDEKTLTTLAQIIMEGAARAGVTNDDNDFLVLTAENVRFYQEWNAKELYVGDRVKIISPAWVQNKSLLESGFCQIAE